MSLSNLSLLLWAFVDEWYVKFSNSTNGKGTKETLGWYLGYGQS
jgi:hypothetical protein